MADKNHKMIEHYNKMHENYNKMTKHCSKMAEHVAPSIATWLSQREHMRGLVGWTCGVDGMRWVEGMHRMGQLAWLLGWLGDGLMNPSCMVINSMCVCIYIYMLALFIT
jgi:hypothetical protein